MSIHKCKNGHTFERKGNCRVCPHCEKINSKVESKFPGLSAPARRALENAGIKSVDQLALYSKAELLSLHGLGPSSIPLLEELLKKNKHKFRTT